MVKSNKNTKDNILFTARTLFNTYGYNQISMRDIADVLHISVGNLTYHFKRKEDLIEALVIEDYRVHKHFKVPKNFEDLHAFFEEIENHHGDTAYYYRHFVQLSNLSDKIHEIQESAQANIYHVFHDCFLFFQEEGYFKKEQYPNQYDSLIQMIMTNNLFGAPYTGYYVNEDLISMYWDVLHLLFTRKGQLAFQQLKNTMR